MNETINNVNVTDNAAVTDNVPVNDNSPALVTSADAPAFNALAAVGAKRIDKAAAKAIHDAGGYVPIGASDTLLTLASTILKNSKVAAETGRKTAIALALIEESGEYMRLKTPSGRYFKSASELFAAMFPTLAQSTIRNYLNAARTVYLPAAKGTLEPELMPLNDLEPGTVMCVCSAMNDKNARKALPQALKEVQGDKPRITQTMVKNATKIAKAQAEKASSTTPSNDIERPDGTTPTPESDEKAARAAMLEAYRIAIRRIFRPDVSDGDIHLLITESDVPSYVELLNDAVSSAEKSFLFVNAMRQAINTN